MANVPLSLAVQLAGGPAIEDDDPRSAEEDDA
jgi:hypothetical protein